MGRILLATLWMRAGFDCVFVVYLVIWATSYYAYYLLDAVDATGFFTYLVYSLVALVGEIFYPLQTIADGLYWLTVLCMLVWLYRLHINLRAVFEGYPILPWGAVARFAVPFYSLWGIWSMFTTLVSYLSVKSKELAHQGILIRRSLLGFYGALIASNVSRQIYWFQVHRAGEQNTVSPWLYVLTNVAALGLSIAWLQLVRLTMRSLNAAIRLISAKASA